MDLAYFYVQRNTYLFSRLDKVKQPFDIEEYRAYKLSEPKSFESFQPQFN